MSLIATSWRNIKHWWQGTESKYEVSINQYPKEKAVIGIGGSTKISAYVTTSSPELFIKWQKVESHGLKNIQTDSIKYSGSSCSMPTPELIIHDVDITDAGVYQLSVTTVTGTIFGPIVRLNVFGDPVDSLPKEERNYLRYYLLCQKIATESVRCYFTRKVPEPTLASHLNTHKSDLKSSYWKCTNDQITVLFPVAPEIAKSSNFDFTLLYKLIRNTITPVSTPTRGWGPTPLSTDIKEEDDIERIRHNRNQLAHNTKFQLNDSDFNNFWTDLSQAIDRLSLGSLKADVIKISEQKLDQQLKNEIFENLKKGIESMKDEINTIHQDMKECTERIQTIEDTHIPPNIRRTQIELLKVWKQDDELYYNSTNVYQASKDKIESFLTVALVGGPGCGKTATARHIALQYEQNGWEIVPVFRSDEIVLYGDSKLKQIFVLDDILGIFALDVYLYNNINYHKEGIMNAISKESKLLFTCRKSVYNEAVKLKSFVLENVVDLESKENILNNEEKGNLLAKHCRFTGVPKDIYCNLSLSSSFIMFPLLCKIFSTKYANHVSVDKFFASPFACLSNELDMMSRSSPQLYAALVLCVLSNNVLSIEKIKIDEKEMKLDAYNTCGVNLGTSDKEIKNSLSHLVGSYLSENENTFTFLHDAIYEITAYHYGKTDPQMILRYMNSNFISTKVTVYKDQRYDASDGLSILIEEEYYEQLAERLYTDLKYFELFDVFMNKSLRYLPFLKIFIKTLRDKPYYELKPLICHEQASSKFISTVYYNDGEIGTIKNEHEEQNRQALLENYYLYAKVSHYPRIISWIIYYGHTNILTSIVSLVKENNDSTDIVFGSDIKEQTRILTLGCYSGDNDMMNEILKYVKIDSVNRTSLDKTLNWDESEMDIYRNGHRVYTPLTSACILGNLSVVQILLRNNANIDQCDDLDYFPLLTASEHGHNDVVEYLVQNGGNVNQYNENNVTSLYGASYNGHYNVVKYLIQQGANVNKCDTLNQSPLHVASIEGHKAIVEFLVENGADVHQSGIQNKSPLYETCERGHTAVLEFLVEKGADVHQLSIKNESPLYEASAQGNKAVVEFLVEKGADVHQSSIKNKSPLYAASAGGHKAVVEFLVMHGADVHQSSIKNQSPLYAASAGGHKAVIEFLVKSGADVNQSSTLNISPLYKACERRNPSIPHVVEFLIQHGADVHKYSKKDQSPLYIACKIGHKAVVKFLVEKGADINHCDTDNQSPLYAASARGDIAVVEYLVEKGANHIHKCCTNDQSPLYKACEGGYRDVVEFLVENGANIHHCDKDNQSPLYKASEGGHVDVVKFLVANGADVNQCGTGKQSPLNKACEGGYKAVVKFLVDNGANVNQCDILERSPLYTASEGRNEYVPDFRLVNRSGVYLDDNHVHFEYYKVNRKYAAVVEFLVKNGADVNKCNRRYQSPLYKACEGGHIAVVEFLIEKGADIHQCDIFDKSPLYQACKGGHIAVVKFLVENGADVNKSDRQYLSPLYKACEGRGHIAVVEFLIEKGADVNQCDIFDMSPLYKACEWGHIDVVEFLIEKAADVNQCDIFKVSPLTKACEKRNIAVAEFLIKKGADVNQCDIFDKSPLYKACEWGHIAVVEFLIEKGADVNQCNKGFKSPLFKACEGGHLAVVKLLVEKGSDINKCDIFKKSPLYKAGEKGHKAVVQFLKKNGADVKNCRKYNQYTLYKA